MSEIKKTPETSPGPWYQIRTGVFDRQGRGVVSHTDMKLTERAQADMRLIAAAPEMLIALKGIGAALSQNKTFPADVDAAKKWAADAIKKAEGK